jgi:hypothetical protein
MNLVWPCPISLVDLGAIVPRDLGVSPHKPRLQGR